MSAMSELATELDTATRCATVGCKGVPTALLVWTSYPNEAVCTPCGQGYSRRTAGGFVFVSGPDYRPDTCEWQTGYGLPWTETCGAELDGDEPWCAEHVQTLADLYPNR